MAVKLNPEKKWIEALACFDVLACFNWPVRVKIFFQDYILLYNSKNYYEN